MEYPYRTDAEQAAVDHLPHSPYANDDAPHLSTARYSMSGYEKRDVEQKILVATHGAQDNLYWYNLSREENRVGR